jgi:NAD(P)-dependent dehydrogenase (short-subunit alcohol dehydrogenase family)
MAKRIVLTGVTRGLGRALVPLFASAKHNVFGCGRTHSAIDELAKKYAAPHQFTALDVRDAAAVTAWAHDILRTAGPPDLLIANAAMMHSPAPLWTIPGSTFDDIIDVNIKGVANLIRAFVPAMVARKQGVIVTLSSGWGRSTSPEVAPYCATKYAVEGLTHALAQELPPTMAAIPLNPGVIDTEMLRQCWHEKAGTFPKADAWAKRAAPFLLNLSSKESGKSLSVPG